MQPNHLDPSNPHQVFAYKIVVEESDLDVFGHVNNANYLRFMETARWHFITDRGYGLEKIQKERKGPVLLDVTLKFRRELKHRDEITIYSQAQKVEGKFLTLKQNMVLADGRLAAEATFLIGFFDLDTRKLLLPTDDWLVAVGWKG